MSWDERYSGEDYLFGTAPAQFLLRHRDLIRPGGTALCVADGEGRNSVWLAEQGLSVTAWDSSAVALEKGRRLARGRNVSVEFLQADAQSFDWPERQYDHVVAIFVQFAPPDLRAAMFDGMLRAAKPGGLVMLHGYTPDQMGRGTGGPPCPDHMYTVPMLTERFGDYEILQLREYEADLQEGRGHSGPSSLIDLILRNDLRK